MTLKAPIRWDRLFFSILSPQINQHMEGGEEQYAERCGDDGPV